MPNEPPSQMIRVPTPLVGAVRELARLHRIGRTKAVLEGIEKLVAAIDSETDIDIDIVAKAISNLTKRLERLEKVEADINMIALTIQDLSTRVSNLEGVGDIGYAVTPLSELELSADIPTDVEPIAEPPADIATDSDAIIEAANQRDITSDSEPTAESESPPQLQAPLTQSALAMRLGISDKAIQKQRQKGKGSFAQWSCDRDPEGVSWSWEGTGGRGQPLRFTPVVRT